MGVFRRHMTFANVISAIALFVALGGSSYAAVSTGGDDAAAPGGSEQGTAPGTTTEPAPDQGKNDDPSGAELKQPPDGQPNDRASSSPPAPSEADDPESDLAPPPENQTEDPVDAEQSDHKRSKAGRSEARSPQGGPPPWAPAHGWRCKKAGNAPGSPAFQSCIHSSKR
jgi:hypothetical protein